MLAKCANPKCSASFRYLHQGRLFVLDVSENADTGGPCRNERLAAHRLRYFWLCDTCRRSMTVVTEQGWKVEVVPFTALQGEQTPRRAPVKFFGTGLGAVEEVRRKPAV
jgi:hypothetical protein